MGLHCSDCAYATFTLHEESGLYQGACSRGYTLTNPHVATTPENHFADPTSASASSCRVMPTAGAAAAAASPSARRIRRNAFPSWVPFSYSSVK